MIEPFEIFEIFFFRWLGLVTGAEVGLERFDIIEPF
jgi:hypothetical protein